MLLLFYRSTANGFVNSDNSWVDLECFCLECVERVETSDDVSLWIAHDLALFVEINCWRFRPSGTVVRHFFLNSRHHINTKKKKNKECFSCLANLKIKKKPPTVFF